LPTEQNESSPSRNNLIVATESLFTGGGFVIGVLAFLVMLRIGERILGYPQLSFIGWTGCLQIIPFVLGFTICISAGLLLGWWLWLRLVAKRFALTKQEVYLLAAGPFRVPIVSRLALRMAGITKVEEEQLRNARKKRL
jgi:hypothetical protein